jgi:hypothetical protein
MTRRQHARQGSDRGSGGFGMGRGEGTLRGAVLSCRVLLCCRPHLFPRYKCASQFQGRAYIKSYDTFLRERTSRW